MYKKFLLSTKNYDEPRPIPYNGPILNETNCIVYVYLTYTVQYH